MNPTVDAFLRSWVFAPWLLVTLLVGVVVYLRGWLGMHRRDPQRWHGGQLAAFLGGLGAIYLALASPLETFATLLLQVHMVQHLLLMIVAPALLWLAEPFFPLLRGLPRPVLVFWVAPLLAWRPLRKLFARFTHPLIALPIFVAITWIWHIPACYELALRSEGWHYLEHLCFLAAGLLFWYPVIRPYPSRPRWSCWLLLPCLLAVDLSNTLLSALLTFSEHVLYPHYENVPRLAGLSALEDQSTAGVIMWVPGSLAFLLPLFALGVRMLSPPEPSRQIRKEPEGASSSALSRSSIPLSHSWPQPVQGRIPLPLTSPAGQGSCQPETSGGSSFDLLRVPVVGTFLKWRYARLCLQLPLLILAGLVIYDGLFGPPIAAMNLAGVLPWIHWRGLLILGLLVMGNVFCMGCPFLLPRTIARWWLPARWNWPRHLRSKWLAVLLLVIFLWAYEALALWDRPGWTAGLALGYFVGALTIDGLFRGASFCKYLCPIGQFNFVQSLASPLEIQPRDQNVCSACQTKDCIRGRAGIPGCELHLFLPRKASNMDCTNCLDCVHACPHDNVGLVARPPGVELWQDRQRSGIGRFSQRTDIAAVILVLVFGSFANAAGMVAPVTSGLEWSAELVGIHTPLLATTVFYVLTLILLPVLAVGGAAELSRRWSGAQASTREVVTRHVYALVPLGFGMWLAHYSFHFLTSSDTALSVVLRFATDHGLSLFGEVEWNRSCCCVAPGWLLPLEILFLDLGLLLSLYTGYRMIQGLKALVPWALLMVLLYVVGVWILFQPMQMRGTF